MDINFKSMYIEIQAVDKTLLVSMTEAFFLFWVQKVCTLFIISTLLLTFFPFSLAALPAFSDSCRQT